MAAGTRYRPRHASRRRSPVLALAFLLAGMLASGANALSSAMPESATLNRGFGRFG